MRSEYTAADDPINGEKEFSKAINKFLNEETKMINYHKKDLETLGPYKN